jgi:hypothetical protein
MSSCPCVLILVKRYVVHREWSRLLVQGTCAFTALRFSLFP